LPLKGISRNLNNPFIVYTILFDYFITKGNLYLVRGGIRNLICKLYQNIQFVEYSKSKKKKIISFSRSYLVPRLTILDFGIRQSMGLNTYDRQREIFAYYTNKTD
jgi:hypothetical protein